MSFARWNDGARACVVQVQRCRDARGDGQLSELHLLHGVLSSKCDAADVLRSLGVTAPLDPGTGSRPAPGLGQSSVLLIQRLQKAVRVEATRRRDPVITSCHLATVLIASEGGPLANGSAASAMERQGHDLEVIRTALHHHLDQAIAELRSQAAG